MSSGSPAGAPHLTQADSQGEPVTLECLLEGLMDGESFDQGLMAEDGRPSPSAVTPPVEKNPGCAPGDPEPVPPSGNDSEVMVDV